MFKRCRIKLVQLAYCVFLVFNFVRKLKSEQEAKKNATNKQYKYLLQMPEIQSLTDPVVKDVDKIHTSIKSRKNFLQEPLIHNLPILKLASNRKRLFLQELNHRVILIKPLGPRLEWCMSLSKGFNSRFATCDAFDGVGGEDGVEAVGVVNDSMADPG